MLRVGLTGGLGSGKSTAAAMFAALGAEVLSSDEIGRQLMQPGERVYAAIVARFGARVVAEDGTLDRAELSRIAFGEGRAEELNAIVHPAVIARQDEMMQGLRDDAIVVVESALIFETQFGGGWRQRFDRMILVTAPDALKVARFVARAGGATATREALEAEAGRRLARQIPDDAKVAECDYVLRNDGNLTELEAQVAGIWRQLSAVASAARRREDE